MVCPHGVPGRFLPKLGWPPDAQGDCALGGQPFGGASLNAVPGSIAVDRCPRPWGLWPLAHGMIQVSGKREAAPGP
jgi:hypothetical protein